MVLRNCLVLAVIALVSQVVATPHGYGVKGGAGAVAKAEASASAGAFSGLPPIPIPIPSGAGFSGSYSKSSSSSFASSSASSSASSFSFSGTGVNSVNGIDLSGGCSSGSCGCSTGACQDNGVNGVTTANNGEQGKYGTVAQSTGTNTQGSDCSSGQCGNKPNLGCTGVDCSKYHDNEGNPSTNCKSGNCGQTNFNSPNDIYVNTPGRTTNNPEEPIKYDVAGNVQNLPSNGKISTHESECNSYGCISPSQNPETDDEKKPSSYDVPIYGTTVPSYFPDKKEPCTSSDCQSNDSSNNNPIKPSYNNNLPESQSTQECAGGICTSQIAALPINNPSLKPFSSPFNVPNSVNVHTNQPTYNAPENCGSLGCGNVGQPHAIDSKNPKSFENSGKSTPSHNYFSSTGHPNCQGPNCDTLGNPSTNLNSKQPSNTFKYPGDCGTLGCGLTLQSGTSNNEKQAQAKGSVDNFVTSVDQSGLGNGVAITKQPYFSSSSDCGSSSCGAQKTDASYPHTQPIYQNGNSLANTKCQGAYCGKPSNANFDTSNGPTGNCGPSGCSTHGNAGNIPSYNQPGYGGIVSPSTPVQASPSPSQSWSTQSTVSPSTSIELQGNTGSNSGTSYKPSSPVSSPSTELIPPNQNSGLGVNTRPYEGVNPNESIFNNKQDTPGYASGYDSPSTNQNPNIPSKPTNGFDVPLGSPKPNNNKQIYTGGFGAPNGPIDQSIPAKPHVTSTVSPSTQVNISPSNIPSVSPYKPVNSGSYNQNPIQSSPSPHDTVSQPSSPKDTVPSNPSYFPSTPQYSQNTNIPSKPSNGFDVKPFESPKPNNNNQIYTGGFGAPNGPIDQSIPAKPHVTSTVSPSTQADISPSYFPSASPYKPVNSYNQKPVQSSPAPHVTVPQPSVSKDNKKGVLYTGGFGGPSGFLNPNDYSIPAKLPTPGTGSSITGPNGYSVSAKPSTPVTGPSNAAPCTSNNCGIQSNHATYVSSGTHSNIANAHAHAAASAVAYTGGFGGPPGFLKPYDEGKVPTNGNINGNPSSNLQGAAGNLGFSNTNYKNTGNGIHGQGSDNTGAVAQANAVATSSAGAYGLGAGLNGGGVKGCSLGCGATSGNGADGFDAHNYGINAGAVASAKSVAGAGSYGAGGSYASSSASAHASAGAATKGGYGRR